MTMGQQTGIDIAWDRPTVDQIKATGATWVARYFSNDVTKNLTATEVAIYTAATLGIVTVWEATATRALQGFQAGVDDAKAARAQRAAVGLPADDPIYWAVDTDTDYASVKPYADGWASVIPKSQSGPYGGFKVVDAARRDGWAYGWQTTAWSGHDVNGQWVTDWSPLATIRQTGGTTLAGGADYDTAEVPDFGQYPRPSTPEADVNLTDKMPEYAGIKQADGTVYIPTVGECINGAKTADTQLTALDAKVTALTAKVEALTVPQLTPEQLQQLAAALAPALVPAILSGMGHRLDGSSA
jgi:hypothetical protein